MRFAHAKSIGLRRLAYISGNPAFVTAFNTDSGIEPTLVLDYENDSYWEDVDGTDTFASLHTFTRASDATYRDNTGTIQTATTDEKRLDHDKDGNALGLLIEESRTNVIVASEDMSAGDWTANAGVTVSTDIETSPDGATTADKLVTVDASSAENSVAQTDTAPGTSEVLSAFMKAAGWQYGFIRARNATAGAFVNTFFDLQNGTVHSTGTGMADAKIEDYGNGWYRCSVRTTRDHPSVAYGTSTSGTSHTDTGDGVSGMFLWGVQLEEGSFPTSYIPTAGSAVTRAADVCSVATSKFGHNAASGTWFVDYILPDGAVASGGSFTAFDHATDSNNRHRYLPVISGTDLFMQHREAASNVGLIQAGTPSDGAAKAATAYAEDDFTLHEGGAEIGTDVAGTPTITPDTVHIGVNEGGGNHINGHIKALVYYAERIPNSDLVALTT